MVRIDGEIIIYRPQAEVFDFVADERNEPKYKPRMLRAEQISDGPIGLGTRFRAEIKQMRGTAEMVIGWTDFDRPRRLASATHLSAMEIEGALTFAAVPEGTLMRWMWEVSPRGALKLMTPLVAHIGRRQEEATGPASSTFSKGRRILSARTECADTGRRPSGIVRGASESFRSGRFRSGRRRRRYSRHAVRTAPGGRCPSSRVASMLL